MPFIIYLTSLGTSEQIVLSAPLYFTMFGWVLLGEAIGILAVGYPLFLILVKRVPSFGKLIGATRNIPFAY